MGRAKEESAPVNRLSVERSPYLQQHATNPVDWYPWSTEAFERARKEDKPLLISIGYSTCHWCHVMADESFEDPETARMMNELFVNIKVDREEHPRIDSLYMKSVQALSGRAGWPLTVFATPEGLPFFGGTYFPLTEAHGLPSFKNVLRSVSQAYKHNRTRIDAVTSDVLRALSEFVVQRSTAIDIEAPTIALEAAKFHFDPIHGGFGSSMKFPNPLFLKFLLMHHRRTGSKDALDMAEQTLAAMANNAIHDQLGNGFHRYTVDEAWAIPHFEKMLYDNALLIELYALASNITGKKDYKTVSLETAGFIQRDLISGDGFASAIDADSPDGEGAYYLWTPDEVRTSLAGYDAQPLLDYYMVTRTGNYEGKNTLRVNTKLLLSEQDTAEVEALRQILFEARKKRRAPAIDAKVIVAWNGLAISALAAAGAIFNNSALIGTARSTASFLLAEADKHKGLFRYWLGNDVHAEAGLEDYALLGSGLLTLHEATKEARWLDEGVSLADSIVELFYDDKTRTFFDSPRGGAELFLRERDLLDNDLPSGNSSAALLFIRLSRLVSNVAYRDFAEQILTSAPGVREDPLSYGAFLCAMEEFFTPKGFLPD